MILNPEIIDDIVMIIIPLSTVDEIGKLSTSIFVNGCSFRCPFCQNEEITRNFEPLQEKVSKVISVIEETTLSECVVISGGEPTIQKGIIEFISAIKRTGKPVYLNTNGCDPLSIGLILPFVHGISMDIKSSFSKYPSAVGLSNLDMESIKKSIDLLINNCSRIKIEFRTTMVNPLSVSSDVIEISKYLSDRGFDGYYALQQYDGNNVRGEIKDKLDIVSTDEMIETATNIKDLGFKVFVRTLDRGIIKFF